jgi:hypothetical protein
VRQAVLGAALETADELVPRGLLSLLHTRQMPRLGRTCGG